MDSTSRGVLLALVVLVIYVVAAKSVCGWHCSKLAKPCKEQCQGSNDALCPQKCDAQKKACVSGCWKKL